MSWEGLKDKYSNFIEVFVFTASESIFSLKYIVFFTFSPSPIDDVN